MSLFGDRPPIVFLVGDDDFYANRRPDPIIKVSELRSETCLAGLVALLEKHRKIFGTVTFEVRMHPDQLDQLDPALRARIEAGPSSTDTQ